MKKEQNGFKEYLGLTFLIGFGFFTMGLMDPLYDTYVPAFLGKYIDSKFVIGFVMTLDNVLQLFLISVVAIWSDRTRTRIGRRMPFILVMLPLAALFFALVPYAAQISLAALIFILFMLNIFKTSVRGPVVALMPDTIPGEFRSEANGVINTMGGIGTILGTLVLAQLMNLDIVLPILGSTKDRLPFPVASLFVILAVIILFLFVRERNHDGEAVQERIPVIQSIKAVMAQKDKSAFLILTSIFLWFMAHEGVKPFLGLYSRDALGASSGMMALPQGIAGIAYALAAIPMGYLAHRYGRRLVIRASLIGLVGITALFAVFSMVGPGLGLAGTGTFYVFLGMMFVYGIFWGSVITNSFPMLWQMSTFGTIGIFTGLYYTFSQSASILAPPVTGLVIDITNLFKPGPEYQYTGIFIFASLCMLGAFLVMAKVHRGEPGDPANS
ncbi:MAG: MFS transporter [Spirochaetes bacterium RIFOXYC1_FULL_54_7]|nr:MAG: MFS transporter [Spirochaetes bacterium RIFOXYC1_FULL_54_7]